MERYNVKNKTISRNGQNPFCDDTVNIIPNVNDKNFMSRNQRLAGKANPKTLIAPPVIAPTHSLDFWRANNFINHSHINTNGQFDSYLSGQDVSNCCDNLNAYLVPNLEENENIERYSQTNDVYSTYGNNTTYIGVTDKSHPYPKRPPMEQSYIKSPQPVVTSSKLIVEGYEANRDPLSQHGISYNPIKSPQPSVTNNFINNSNFTESFSDKNDNEKIRYNEPGWVNTVCGYDPNQTQYGLPNNLSVGNCEKTQEMTKYNKNLFTQNIQPDSYMYNEVIEPINSNIGISFTQQFEPLTCSRTDGKGLTYVEHDPRTYRYPPKSTTPPTAVSEYDVYDPRFSGYGTSYRSYNEDVTGQTRFYYDDINAVRMPNYISRSKIDFANYADSYGPLTDKNQYGNVNTNNIHALAQDSFLRSSINQRDDLQRSLLRKRNAEMWQLRKYPIHTMGNKRS